MENPMYLLWFSMAALIALAAYSAASAFTHRIPGCPSVS